MVWCTVKPRLLLVRMVAPEKQVEPGRRMRDADLQADFQTVSAVWFPRILTNRFIVWTCSPCNIYTFGVELFHECPRMVSAGRVSFSASGGKNEAFLVPRFPER